VRHLSLLLLVLIAASAHAAITGTVVDENGKPVAGATIKVYPSEGSRAVRLRLLSGKPEREPLTSTASKDDGTFSADTKGTAAVDLVIESGARRRGGTFADNLDLGPVLLREPAPHTIKVTAGGKPVANALVAFNSNYFTRTDAAGTFTANESNSATFIHPDFAIEQTSFGGTSSEVKLQKGVALKGRVLGANGQPAPKATVAINGFPLATSAEDGTFAIAHAPSNWQTIYAFAGSDAGLATRGAAAIEIRLKRGAVLSGVVRDTVTGEAVPGAIVTLGNATSRDQQAVPADAKGRYTFDPMPQGTYNLGAQHWSYSADQTVFPLTESASRSVAARPYARIYGRVMDEERKPVAGALVGGSTDSTRRTITDAAGNFLLRLPAELRLARAVALKRGFAAGLSPRWNLKPGEVIKDVVITLPQGFPLQVRVVDRGQRPVAGVRVGLGTREEGAFTPAACEEPARDACGVTGANGLVTYRIVEGDYSIFTRGEPARIIPVIRELTLNARSSPFTLQVEAGVSVSGKVVYADGTPAANANVAVETTGARRDADAAGLFTIDSLPATRLSLVASAADRRLTSNAVEVTPPAQNVTITLPRGGRIEGRVTERGSGRPITDFTVAPERRRGGFGGGPPTPGQTVHAEDGAFVLDNIAPGNASVSVSASGYVSASRTDIVVEEGAAVTGVEVQLDRAARVTGRVTAGGKPLAGVAVMLGFSPGSFGGTPSRAVTDGDGEYVLDGISAGERTFDFRKQGFVTRRKSAEVAAAKDTRLDVELDRGHELHGRVIDSSGAGVAGANVSAQAPARGGEEPRAVSEADGSFVIEGLSESRYNITARKSGMVSATERDVDLPATAPVTLTLKSGAVVTGRVTGLPEHELAGVRVYAYGMGQNNSTSGQTDASGAFTLRGVPDGQVTISANVAGGERRAQPKTITVTNGSAPPVQIDFAEGYTMRGRVTMNGVPMAAGSLNFAPATPGSSRPFASARINNGLYEANGLGSGEYRVMVLGPEVRYEEKIEISGSGTHDVDVRGANVRGRVVDAATGAPVVNAGISLRGKGMAGRNAQSDSDGRFLFAAVPDDTYTLVAVSQPYSPVTKDVVIAGGSAPEIEVRMAGGTPVVVKIVDAMTGKIMSNANASVSDAKGQFITGNMQRDEEGIKFYLEPGQYTLNAQAQGYVPQRKVAFSVPTGDVRVVLQRAGAIVFITSQVRRVRLVPAGGGAPAFIGSAAPNQMFGPQNIAPGSYVLEILGKGDAVEKSIPVTVIAGETVTVPLD